MQHLSKEVLYFLADQISTRLSESAQRAAASGDPLEIAESFPIWMVGLSSLTEESLEQAAFHTGYWHHQIRHGQRAVEFAKSRPLGPLATDWRLEELAESPIAAAIDHAIGWVDENVREDESVRLLVIPAYFVHAFWIGTLDRSRLLPIDLPSSVHGLELGHLYQWKEFREILLRQPYVEGIPPQEPSR